MTDKQTPFTRIVDALLAKEVLSGAEVRAFIHDEEQAA